MYVRVRGTNGDAPEPTMDPPGEGPWRDPGQRDRAGLTPLDQAALAGETALAEMLIAHGASIDLPAAVAPGRSEDVEPGWPWLPDGWVSDPVRAH